MRKAVMFSLLTCLLAAVASAQSQPAPGALITPPQVPHEDP